MRGDWFDVYVQNRCTRFLLAPLREGRLLTLICPNVLLVFLLAPLREGRRAETYKKFFDLYFYSRPCVRGDPIYKAEIYAGNEFLLAPLREGRRNAQFPCAEWKQISTRAPA